MLPWNDKPAENVLQALDLCALHNIPLSEDMAEKMCPTVGDRGVETDELRTALLAKVS